MTAKLNMTPSKTESESLTNPSRLRRVSPEYLRKTDTLITPFKAIRNFVKKMLNLQKLQKSKSGFKGIGNLFVSQPEEAVHWNILKDNVALPAATLSRSILDHNELWMQKFSEKFGFQRAPHGKTTMQPELFQFQIASGCWGITMAAAHQVAVAYKCGVTRTIMANQLVGHCNMEIISTILSSSPSFEFICLVDSPENVNQLGNFFSSRNQKIKVLLEYGIPGGRTGVRNEAQEKAVVSSLEKWKDTILLVGVEFFEGIGVLQGDEDMREFIRSTLSRIHSLVAVNAFSSNEIIITGAGTAFFDIVSDEFTKFEQSCTTLSISIKKILRSGCYLIYDRGLYERMEGRVSKMGFEREGEFAILARNLQPALKLWAHVHSIPEPNLAIIGLGKRDVGVDSGFPVPAQQYRPNNNNAWDGPKTAKDNWKVFNTMDQHTFMRISDNDDIQVGDIISFDIYHACTTMDKWRNVLMIDDDYNVIDVLNSDF